DQRVRIYKNDGTYSGSFGDPGSNLVGKFLSPFGVAVGPSSVFVADSGSGNITQFTRSGGFLCSWSSVLTPQMIVADNSSDVYVADSANNDVAKYSACSSNASWISGSTGSMPGLFEGPVGVAIDGHSNVFVGDSGNFRVQKLSASTGAFILSMTYPRPGLFA